MATSLSIYSGQCLKLAPSGLSHMVLSLEHRTTLVAIRHQEEMDSPTLRYYQLVTKQRPPRVQTTRNGSVPGATNGRSTRRLFLKLPQRP
jgi:hypothetical protein